MSNRFGNAGPGEFLKGLILPPVIHGHLRKLLTLVDTADSPVNCLIAQARAESLIEALELLKVTDSAAIERLYLLVDETVTQRMLELEQGGQV